MGEAQDKFPPGDNKVHFDFDSNTIVKFPDDTTVVGLISKGDESAYRDEVRRLTERSEESNLLLNTSKTQELIISFSRVKPVAPPLVIKGECVETVSAARFLGVHIEEDLKWGLNTTQTLKKAQQRLHFLRVLRRNNIRQSLLVSFYRCSIESILTYCIGVWFGSCTAVQKGKLQRVVSTAQKVIGCSLPSLEELYESRVLRRAENIMKDASHPGHSFFRKLPSGRRLQALGSRTNRLRNSFFPSAVRIMNAANH